MEHTTNTTKYIQPRKLSSITKAECLALAKLLYPSAKKYDLGKLTTPSGKHEYQVWVTDLTYLNIDTIIDEIRIEHVTIADGERLNLKESYLTLQYLNSIGIKMSWQP